ncbi:MAG TPA: hypothetical protein VHH73_04675 [Verrucomicrobiae bacterium]|nr:hypothetical protein [Verrucomicrobiae bacterium]
MKGYLALVCGVSLLMAGQAKAAQPAQVQLFCYSVKLETASGGTGGINYTLSFSSDRQADTPNGELFPLFSDTQPTHGSYYSIDSFLGALTSGQIAFDVPVNIDANGNAIPDFFEAGQGISATTRGGYTDDLIGDEGTVKAVWQRGAGSRTGICKLTLVSETFGQLPDFSVTFTIFTYTGQFDYTRILETAQGPVTLTQGGNETHKLAGQWSFGRVATNKTDFVSLLSASITNSAGQSLSPTNAFLERAGTPKINYAGWADFADGNLDTPGADYLTWYVVITDTNDSDNNGIPDLSDGLVLPPALSTYLEIALEGQNVLLTIHGVTGKTYALQEKELLATPAWTNTTLLTLTNGTAIVKYPLPTTSTRFWRLQEQ